MPKSKGVKTKKDLELISIIKDLINILENPQESNAMYKEHIISEAKEIINNGK